MKSNCYIFNYFDSGFSVVVFFLKFQEHQKFCCCSEFWNVQRFILVKIRSLLIAPPDIMHVAHKDLTKPNFMFILNSLGQNTHPKIVVPPNQG